MYVLYVYLSKLWKTMIILKDCHVLEIFHSFSCADRGFGILPNPVFNQVEAKLKAKNAKHSVSRITYVKYNI